MSRNSASVILILLALYEYDRNFALRYSEGLDQACPTFLVLRRLSDVEIYCGPQTFLPNLNTNQVLVYVRIYKFTYYIKSKFIYIKSIKSIITG